VGSTREDVAGVEVPGPSSASPSPAAPPATCVIAVTEVVPGATQQRRGGREAERSYGPGMGQSPQEAGRPMAGGNAPSPSSSCRYCGHPASVYVPQLSKAPLCGLCAFVILGDVPARLFLAGRVR